MNLYILAIVLVLAIGTQAGSPCKSSATPSTKSNYTAACYDSPLPNLTASTANRTVPWGTPLFTLPNGTGCCSSLAQIRAGINAIDAELVTLLAQRSGYVLEATRFKATLDSIDVPSRNQQVIDAAVANGRTKSPPLPEIVAKRVVGSIIEAGVAFEKCVFEKYEGEGA